MTLVQKEIKAVYTWTGKITDMRGPCDSGYHVPTNSEWDGLKTIMTGLNLTTADSWKTNLHLPLCGCRDGGDSSLVVQGARCFYWSCTPYGSGNINYAKYIYLVNSTITVGGGYPRSQGMSIRAFKNTFVVPTSSWTVILGTLGSAGIFWNQTDGIISITGDGTTGYTIADKNEGATTVYSDGDTLSESNGGKYYQWGNNYGFAFTGSLTTSSTQVDASNYGPSNPYSSSTFILNGNNWDSSHNDNLRGGVTGVLTEHKIRPEVPATAITLNKSSISLTTVGQTEQLTATLTPADSTSSVSWTSSNTSIATVSSTGLVTCVTPGSCTITATTDNGLTATCSVKGQWAPSANTIFYYDFNQNLNDSSGKGNNPTANAYIGYATQGGQYVASTTGNSPYIQLNKTYGNGLTNFTISFWIYPMKTSGQGDVLVFGSFEEAYPYNGPTIFFLSGGNILVRMGYDISKQPCTWTQNTRQHIVFTRSSGTCSFYKNGALQGTSWTDTRTWNADVFFVFSRNESNQQFKVVGTKGDKYIYENVAWSADDVTDYYNSTKSIYGL